MEQFRTGGYVNAFLLLFSVAVVIGMVRHASPEAVLWRSAIAAGLGAFTLWLFLTAVQVVVAREGMGAEHGERTDPEARSDEHRADTRPNSEPAATPEAAPENSVS